MDNKGNLLCKVDLDDETRISAWKETDKYIGEFKERKIYGNSIEYSKDNIHKIYKKRKSTWKDDIFINRLFYGTALNCEGGVYTSISDDDEQPTCKDYEYIRKMFRIKGSSYCKECSFADARLKS